MYLTYKEYEEMGGQVSCEAAYTRLEFKARKLIDQYTFGRLKGVTEYPEAVKMLMMELVDICEEDDSDTITSVSNDGYSESYAAVDNEAKAENLIKAYLADEKTAEGTPLLYRGVSA